MIIELFGLPGAGKTTIAAGLSERLPAESVDVEGRRDLIWFNLLALLRRPLAYARRTARAFHEPGSRRLQYYKLRYIFLYRNALVPLTEEQLLDELRRLEFPDIALHVTAPTDERKRRLQERGYFSRSGESEEYLRRWEEAMQANDDMVARVLPRLGVRCIRIDGTASLDAVHSALLESVGEAGLEA